jgi:SAM-dependent methyltransferase
MKFKLRDLVKFRESLEAIYGTKDITDAVDLLQNSLNALGKDAHVHVDENTKSEAVRLASDLERIHSDIKFNNERFDLIIHKLNQEAQSESTKFFTDNYELEIEVESEAIDIIRKVRAIKLPDGVQEIITQRLQRYTDWHYPALEIGCRDGEWTQYMISAEPLYIVDCYRDFLESAVKNFTPELQQRVRNYLVKDSNLSALPQNQFNFVFCWNFLNYRSMDTIKEYLKSVKELLRPGGTFMFSYNNGDLSESAGYAEGHWMSYIPKSMLIPLCESLGYEITNTEDVRGNNERTNTVSWIEIRKPGDLSTVKGHPALGEIKRRDH